MDFDLVPSGAGTEGGGLRGPIFCRSVDPIRTGEGRLSPPITKGPSNVFHLPASLLPNRFESEVIIIDT